MIDTETPGLVVMELDDGEQLVIDANDLRAALSSGEGQRPRARIRAACS